MSPSHTGGHGGTPSPAAMVLRASITSGRNLSRWFANERSASVSVSIDGEVVAFSEDRRAVGWAVRLDEASVWDRVDPRDHVVQWNYSGVQPGAQLEGASRRVAVGHNSEANDAQQPCRPRLRRSRDEDVVRPRSESLPPLAVIVDVLATAHRRQHRCHSASVPTSDQRGGVRTPQESRRLTLPGNPGYRMATRRHTCAPWCPTDPANGAGHREPSPFTMNTISAVDHNPNAKPNFPVHVTKGHEAEAKWAQLRKPPSRFGTWVLRRLGYRGEIEESAPLAQTPPSHRRPLQSPPDT